MLLYPTNSLPSRFVHSDSQTYRWFSGTGYLGMAHNTVFQKNIIQSLQRYGTSWGSSRNNNIRLNIYEEAEDRLAQFLGADTALTVSSGMMAGQVAMSGLQQHYEALFIAPNTHPALWVSGVEIPKTSWQNWANTIVQTVTDCSCQNIVIASDSVSSPLVEHLDFRWIQHLPVHKNICIVLDDSHGLGIFGTEGGGIYAEIKALCPPSVRLVVVASLNKALAMSGGVICTDSETIQAIRQTPMFAGASPMMPALLAAFVASIGEYKHQHRILQSNTSYFLLQVQGIDFLTFIEGYPAFCTYQEGFHEYLKGCGILTAHFAYPTPQDRPVTRIVISSLHEKEDIDALAGAIQSY